MTVLIVSKLAQLPHQAVIYSDVIVTRVGEVLKHRQQRPSILAV
jgi:hypothetical protein